ncbi:C6 transcription factor (UaY) [Penicillium malachiteum]|nr:C6 transcription factor (UaY) [Penicillium malachiteum]
MTVSLSSDKSHRKPSLDASSFRNVSACKRCRLRKHKCDQSLPQCGPCEKAQARCVGYDPINKQEIPRSYVYYLENRVKYLDSLLHRHNIQADPPTACEGSDGLSPESTEGTMPSPVFQADSTSCATESPKQIPESWKSEVPSVDAANLFDAAIPHFDATSDLEVDSGLTSGLLSGVAVRYQIAKGGQPSSDGNISVIRSSFFGLLARQSKRNPVDLPRKGVAGDLADIFFRYVNPYTPVLHPRDFQELLDELYFNPTGQHSPLKVYTAFMVFAIGAAKSKNQSDCDNFQTFHGLPKGKRRRLSATAYTSDDYKDSAMAYLNSYMSKVRSCNFLTRLEELQAVLLLCIFTLLKPGVPTLASLLDVAIHSAMDLRLHSDHSSLTDIDSESSFSNIKSHFTSQSYIQELRRRLWWSLYSLERLVAPCLDRPFFIPDEAITTRFPDFVNNSLWSDNGLDDCFQSSQIYNQVTHHHLKLRCLQSEIHRMIQYQHALLAERDQPLEHRWKAPPFLKGPYTFNSWRSKMAERLDEWRLSIPRYSEAKLDLCRALMELEYWQTTIALYRRSISIPEDLCPVLSLDTLMSEFTTETVKERNAICSCMAHACQRVIEIYREMQLSGFSHIA